jgi:hypothetical protein
MEDESLNPFRLQPYQQNFLESIGIPVPNERELTRRNPPPESTDVILVNSNGQTIKVTNVTIPTYGELATNISIIGKRDVTPEVSKHIKRLLADLQNDTQGELPSNFSMEKRAVTHRINERLKGVLADPQAEKRMKELCNRLNNNLLSKPAAQPTWAERAEAGIIEANKNNSPYTGATYPKEQGED